MPDELPLAAARGPLTLEPAPVSPAIEVADDAERVRGAYARRQSGHRYDWDQPGQLFMMQALERQLLGALRRHHCLPLGKRRILEVGCGSGHFLRELIKWGAEPANLVGLDLLEARLVQARPRTPAGVALLQGNAAAMDFADGAFDVVLQMTMFTSILSAAVRRQVAAEMLRVVAPGGWIVWYDLRVNNPRNPDVRAVRAAEIRALFPGATIHLETATLAPPLARTLAPRASWLCSLLAQVRLLRTHYLGFIQAPSPTPLRPESSHA
ncbi:MAG TPA: class I SAM-dependent methyltransferase [Gemmatimonadales bacterium]|jgi:SAM-dependent methyltransferase|nr:class I SAM-dependent methyltransferase [Gemmatimonadales bacterium]